LAFTSGIAFAPPVSFSYLELTDVDDSRLNQLLAQVIGPKKSLGETQFIETDSESFEMVSIADSDNTSDGQEPDQYFQAHSDSAITKLKKHDEER